MKRIDTPNPHVFPDFLPIPIDDGRADHLIGLKLPEIHLRGVDGIVHSLEPYRMCTTVFYFYPQTGVIGKDPAPLWDSIPGAPGCTLQALGYRDLVSEFSSRNISIVGISGQSFVEQRDFAQANKIPFQLFSDEELILAHSLDLPTFKVGESEFIKRLTMISMRGEIQKVFYPVFPSAENASNVLNWFNQL